MVDENGYGERMQTEPTDSFDHHSVPNAVSRLTVFFFAKILSIPMLWFHYDNRLTFSGRKSSSSGGARKRDEFFDKT